jgi:tetratricopeptide (TPR) repeat protein
MLYDAQRWTEAIPYYQTAFKLDPKNANVSTDLGTALWNAGRTDEALAQFDASLAIDPTHANTHFNIGIVRLHGKQDAKGAVEAWQTLLSKNPSYPNADKVRQLIAAAQQG